MEKNYNLVKICEGPITSIRLLGVYESYKKAKEKKIKVILEGQRRTFRGYLNNQYLAILINITKKF